MNEVNSIKNYPISTNVVNFRADEKNGVNNTKLQAKGDQVDTFVKDYEKAKKQAKRDKNLSLGLQIGTFAAFVALAAVSIASATGKFNPAGFKKSGIEFKKYTNDASVGDLMTTKTLYEEQRNWLKDIINSKKIKDEYIELGGLKEKGFPNAAIIGGPSGVGKTESIKMFSKANDSELAIIKMADFGNSYVNGNAISMLEMFKYIEHLLKKNPDKKYTILFDEGDALTRKIKNIDAHNEYLGKDRQSFITGLDLILPYKNVNVFLTTNVPIEQIDEAVITRFGKNMTYEMPNKDQLFEALKFHLKDIKGCKFNDSNFFEDKKDEIMAFITDMENKKCAYRDVQKISKQAAADYVKDMDKQDKSFAFDIKYLVDALKNQGKSAGEIADSNVSLI